MLRWAIFLAVLGGASGCGDEPAPTPSVDASAWQEQRDRMVATTIATRGVKDEAVLAAMRSVPRHAFVPESHRQHAYDDRPLPIGDGQTISQPFLVAIMAQEAHIEPGDKVLEVGTGSGYSAAVLSKLAKNVCTIEIVQSLGEQAAARLKELGFSNVAVRIGDGYQGWAEEGPFDAIIVTAASPEVPEPLKQQLKVGGRLVIPVGTNVQHLRVITCHLDGFREEPLFRVRLGPMTGEAAKAEDR